MVTTFYPPYNFGGDGIFVQRLSNELARRGHRVDVIHCVEAYRVLARCEPERDYEDHPNVSVHGLRSPFGFLSPLATQQTGFPFFKSARIREILKRGFDVIHFHNISLIGGPIILGYGNSVKLYTIHEYWLGCPTHLLFRFKRAICHRPHCFLCSLTYGRLPQWWRYFGLLETMVKHVDAFIAPSRFSKEKHHQMGLNAPIVHLPNFYPDEEASAPTPKQVVVKAQDRPYFLFVGRLKKIKGLQTLIPVFRGYGRAKLLIAGRGSHERQLRQLAVGCVNIKFLGHMSQWELVALYRQAVAAIVPSLSYEVFPQVIIEAFKQETPVVARNLGAMPEIIKESGGGFVYDTEDELVGAMNKLLTDSSCRREMGLRGNRAFQRRWTPEAHLRRYFALIREVSSPAASRR